MVDGVCLGFSGLFLKQFLEFFFGFRSFLEQLCSLFGVFQVFFEPIIIFFWV